jgi:hypothetical protein
MTSLDTKRLLECALAGTSILQALKTINAKMTYGQFARTIGLLGDDEPWKVWHRKQVSDVLYLIGAVEKQTTNSDPIDFGLIVDAHTGESGAGLNREARIVVSP